MSEHAASTQMSCDVWGVVFRSGHMDHMLLSNLLFYLSRYDTVDAFKSYLTLGLPP